MRIVILFVFMVFLPVSTLAQIGIGTSNPDNSSALDVESTTKGVLPPRMTNEQRDAINVSMSSKGLIIYNLDTNNLNLFDGQTWHVIVNNQTISLCSEFNTPASIIDCLQQNYTPDQTLGYSGARDILYSAVDVNQSNQELKGIYTDFTIVMDYSTSADPSIHAFNSGINAEHVFPQSMGAGDEPALSDMYNIFPCRIEANSSRSNCPIDEIEDTDTETWFYLNQQLNTIPGTNIDNYSEKDNETSYPSLLVSQQCSFEPPEDKKGDIARVLFYFYTIYNINNVNAYTSYANDAFFNAMKATLLQWHINDPIDSIEVERGIKIKTYQGNENPFLIDATLPQRIFN